jgi:hypothetical protein
VKHNPIGGPVTRNVATEVMLEECDLWGAVPPAAGLKILSKNVLSY